MHFMAEALTAAAVAAVVGASSGAAKQNNDTQWRGESEER